MVVFNKACVAGNELDYIAAALESGEIAGGGFFTEKCENWLNRYLGCLRILLTPSCTAALEMSAILLDIKPGDEIIMPSYTFVSTANAFVLRGAKIVFVDIRADTMNINESILECALTEKTKAIVVVHYAGVACNMTMIMGVARRHNLFVVEDAAQALFARYKEKPLGTYGHLATFSFHETKNLTSGGEGGALIINDKRFIERAEIIREKGTNRNLFFRGAVDKYSWVDIGSSYLLSEIQAAYLYAQLEQIDKITSHRLSIWERYYTAFSAFVDNGITGMSYIPADCLHNGHIFYLKVSQEKRGRLIDWLKAHGVYCIFHYVPLHSSIAGVKYSRFHGDDVNTTSESLKIIRLPIWYPMSDEMAGEVIDKVTEGVNYLQRKL